MVIIKKLDPYSKWPPWDTIGNPKWPPYTFKVFESDHIIYYTKSYVYVKLHFLGNVLLLVWNIDEI